MSDGKSGLEEPRSLGAARVRGAPGVPEVSVARILALTEQAERWARDRGEESTPSNWTSMRQVSGGRCIQLPAAPCKYCGEIMTDGVMFMGMPLYTKHPAVCEALEAGLRAESRAARQATVAAERARKANLRALGAVGLPEYLASREWGKNRELARYLAEEFAGQLRPLSDAGFMLIGEFGADGSGLVRAIGRTLYEREFGVIYWDATRLYPYAVEESRGQGVGELVETLVGAEVLILDQLGRERGSAWWVDRVLWPITHARAEAGRPTVLYTEFAPEQLNAIYRKAGMQPRTVQPRVDDDAPCSVNAETLLRLWSQVSPAVRIGPEPQAKRPDDARSVWGFVKQ